MSLTTSASDAVTDRLAVLTQELLDAHCDTVCLGGDLAANPDWIAHIEYVKDLQRVGQRILAELDATL